MSFNLNDYLRELEKIVNIDSGSYNIAGISKVADFFEVKFKELGFNVERFFEEEGFGPTLKVTNKDDKNYDVLLIGHMDTVFPEGTVKKRPFKITGERAYGPGVIDMKSGLLMMYYALKSIKGQKPVREPSICAILNGDEEIGSRKSSKLIREAAKDSKIALVFEPSRKNGACVLERKGISGYNLEFNGIAAHAGVEPEKGASAVVEMARWIIELEKLNDFKKGTTVNVGVVKGGTASNVVAENAEASVDLRFKIEDERKKVEEKLEELKASPYVKGVKTKVIHRGIRPAMIPSDATMKLWRKAEEIGEKLGLDMKWEGTGGGSDANTTAGMGVPTIDGMGPIGGGAHGVDEYLEINSVEKKCRLAEELIMASIEFDT